MDFEIVAGISASAVILGLVQLFKSLGFPGRYAGALAVVLGLIAAFAYTFAAGSEWLNAIGMGLVVGLSSAGLWSTGKHLISSDQ